MRVTSAPALSVDNVGGEECPMVDAVRPPQKGLLGRVAGAVTERVVDVVDPDIVLDHVDVNQLLDKIDLQRVLERVDLDPVLSRVDLQALLSRVDLNVLLAQVDLDAALARVDVNSLLDTVDLQPVLERVDLNPVLSRVDLEVLLSRVDLNALIGQVDLNAALARVDVDALLDQVDIQAVARRSGIAEMVAESTSQIAGSTLDVARRQVAALDFWVNRAVDALLRRPPDSLPTGPAGLVRAEEPVEGPVEGPVEVGGRREVTGHYAGPVGRVLAFALDSVVVTLAYTGAGATVDWLAKIFLDRSVVGGASAWVSAVLFASWAFVYFFGSLAVAGRTPGQALVGLRVVARDGSTLPPGSALVRTLCLPVSFLLCGLGLVGVVVGREHRALHDVAGRSAVVLDFGDRPAELPGPLSRFLDRQDL
jgi:uncharacterized RDD family membrane protein YckC